MITRSSSSTLQTLSTHRRSIAFATLGVLAPLAGFGAIAEEIVRHQVFAWDLQVLEVLHARTTPMLNMIMIFITHAGDVQIVGGLVLIALFGLWWLGLERNAIFFRPLDG
jgi:uncharacterized membrane protein